MLIKKNRAIIGAVKKNYVLQIKGAVRMSRSSALKNFIKKKDVKENSETSAFFHVINKREVVINKKHIEMTEHNPYNWQYRR